MISWIGKRIVGLFRSRTLRLVCYGLALWVAWLYLEARGGPAVVLIGKGWGLARPALSHLDPAVFVSWGSKLVFAWIAVFLHQEALKAYNNYGGVQARNFWDTLFKDPQALASYLGQRQIALAILLGLVLM